MEMATPRTRKRRLRKRTTRISKATIGALVVLASCFSGGMASAEESPGSDHSGLQEVRSEEPHESAGQEPSGSELPDSQPEPPFPGADAGSPEDTSHVAPDAGAAGPVNETEQQVVPLAEEPTYLVDPDGETDPAIVGPYVAGVIVPDGYTLYSVGLYPNPDGSYRTRECFSLIARPGLIGCTLGSWVGPSVPPEGEEPTETPPVEGEPTTVPPVEGGTTPNSPAQVTPVTTKADSRAEPDQLAETGGAPLWGAALIAFLSALLGGVLVVSTRGRTRTRFGAQPESTHKECEERTWR